MPEREDHGITIEQSAAADTPAGILEIRVTGPAALAAEARALIVRCIQAAQRVARARLH